MNYRDGEAQPGDKEQPELEGEPLERPAESNRIEMPHKADVARDQARRARPGSQAHRVGEPAYPRIRLTAAHPRSRLRRAGGPKKPGFSLAGLIASPVALVRAFGQSLGNNRPQVSGQAFRPANLRRFVLRRPTLKGVFALAGVAAIVAVVTALLFTLPSNPAAPSASGSIYGITWQSAVKAPTDKIDFGPYFTSYGPDMLMLGTTGSTTTVWGSTDGATWTQRSGSGAFDVGSRRFVAQGMSDDGSGGLVAVGNSLGSSPTDVVAMAWHSRDGSSWTSMPIDSASGQEMIGGVAARPGVAVAAGNGVAWLSTDARTWSPQLLPGASTYTLKAVTAWPGGFIIVGLWNGTGPTRTAGSAAWYSATGRDWAKAATSLDGFDARGIAGANGHVVAVGTDTSDTAPGLAASWSSSDGNTWTKSTAFSDDTTVAMDGVAAVNGTFLAWGAPASAGNPTASASASASPSPSASPTVSAAPTATYAPPSGSAGPSSGKSPTAKPSVAPVASAGASGSAAPSHARPTIPPSTPAPAATESVWVADDGSTWVPIASSSAPISRARMTAVGSKIVLIGRVGGSLSVVTGAVTMGVARKPASESGAPANFALSLQAGDTPMIAEVTKDDVLGPVVNSKDRFMVFLTGPIGTSVWSSPTGSLWSQETDPDGLTAVGTAGRPVVLQAIPDGQGGIIAVGRVTNDKGDNGTIWHMAKAGDWHQAQILDDAPPEISSVASGPNGFVASSDAAGGSPILYSTDGETWQAGAISVASGFPLTVASYRYGFVAVGSDPARAGISTAWTSPDGRTWTMRADWRLPANVTQLFGQGDGLVASAVAVTPTNASSTASPIPSASAGGSAKATVTPKATAVPKATPTPAPAQEKISWYWSLSGVVWQSTGLTTADGQTAVINGEILVLDAPAKASDNWIAWSSGDGKTWQRPPADAFLFRGQRTSGVAAIGDRIVFVGMDGAGQLKDYFGEFKAQ
jgi:hypothetical protein